MTDEKLVEVVARALRAVDLNAPPGYSWRHYMTEARAAIAAYEAAKGGAPAGWVMVPREPTPEMRQAALNASRAHKQVPVLTVGYEMHSSAVVYAAMLAAAPAAPPAVDLEKVEEAIKQALDDMGPTGSSVCGQAKAMLRYALGPMDGDEEAPEYAYDAALRVLVECDETYGKRSPLRDEMEARSVLSDIRKARE